MDNTQLCESLMTWLQTFDLAAPHRSVEEVSDGVAMAEALHQIDPEWFSDAWKSKIKPVAGNNWRLKVSNLKKIVESIVDYYHERLNQHLGSANKPDVVGIGEKCDAEELGKLLQLILGCAINCEQKQGYITRIMAMEELVQQVIMQSIQDLENSNNASLGGAASLGGVSIAPTAGRHAESEEARLRGELEAANEARDQLAHQMAQRCHELDMQVTLLQEEKTSVAAENRRLLKRLEKFEAAEGPSSVTGNRQKELRKQMDALNEDIFKAETARDDYRAKVEMQEKELLESHSKIEELQKMADEARHLKDENDILRETADRAGKYEATIASYKKKLDEFGDLKRQAKLFGDKNTEYMTQVMELEGELKKSAAWKTQLELYKKQVTELHQRHNDETKRADKGEFENKKLQEKLNALQREKERLVVERDSLKETNDELKCSQLQIHDIGNSPSTLLAETVAETMIPPDMKEKLVRLRHENKMLLLNQRDPAEDKLPELQALLDDANQQINLLRVENRETNRCNLELESQVKEMQEREEREEGGGSGLRQRIADLQEQLRGLQAEKEKRQALLEERDLSVAEHKQKAASALEALRRKESELEALNERYHKYIEKAKSVIKTLDPKQNAVAAQQGSSADVALLRSQLLEKHKLIEDMEVRRAAEQKERTDAELRLWRDGEWDTHLARAREVKMRLTQVNCDIDMLLARRRQQSEL